MELNAKSIKEIRDKMSQMPGMTITPNEVMIHPSWFLQKDGTVMEGERKAKRYAAIKRWIKIRLRRGGGNG